MKYTAEECEKLEGKEIEYTNKWFEPKNFTAIVIGCDPDIGITIVDKNNKEQNLFCLPGPHSKEWNVKELAECYDRVFENAFQMIVSNRFDIEQSRNVRFTKEEIEEGSIHGPMMRCPYSS